MFANGGQAPKPGMHKLAMGRGEADHVSRPHYDAAAGLCVPYCRGLDRDTFYMPYVRMIRMCKLGGHE